MHAVSYHILIPSMSCSPDQGELYTLEHGLSVRVWRLCLIDLSQLYHRLMVALLTLQQKRIMDFQPFSPRLVLGNMSLVRCMSIWNPAL